MAASHSSGASRLFDLRQLELDDSLIEELKQHHIDEEVFSKMTWDDFEILIFLVGLQDKTVFLSNVKKAFIDRDSKDLPSPPSRPVSRTWKELLSNHPDLTASGLTSKEIDKLYRETKITPELLIQFKDMREFLDIIPLYKILDLRRLKVGDVYKLWQAIVVEKRILAREPAHESKEPIARISTMDELFSVYHLDMNLLQTLKDNHYDLSLLYKMMPSDWQRHSFLQKIPLGISAACMLALNKEKGRLVEGEKIKVNTAGLDHFNTQAVKEYKDFFENYQLRIPFQPIVSHLLERGISLNILKKIYDEEYFRKILPAQIKQAECIELELALQRLNELELSEDFNTLKRLHRLEEAALSQLLASPTAIQPLAQYLGITSRISPETQRQMLEDAFKINHESVETLKALHRIEEIAIHHLIASGPVLEVLAEYLDYPGTITTNAHLKIMKGEEWREKKEIVELDPIVSVEEFIQRYNLTLPPVWRNEILPYTLKISMENGLINLDSFYFPQIYGNHFFFNLSSFEKFIQDLEMSCDRLLLRSFNLGIDFDYKSSYSLTDEQARALYAAFKTEKNHIQQEFSRIEALSIDPVLKKEAIEKIRDQVKRKMLLAEQKAAARASFFLTSESKSSQKKSDITNIQNNEQKPEKKF